MLEAKSFLHHIMTLVTTQVKLKLLVIVFFFGISGLALAQNCISVGHRVFKKQYIHLIFLRTSVLCITSKRFQKQLKCNMTMG